MKKPLDLRNINLNLLVAFDALLTERSVTQAAARLSVTQSAMSASLSRLREFFDDPILVRDGRKMIPTPLGEKLSGRVRHILNEIQNTLVLRDDFDPGKDEFTFTITASEYETLAILQPLLSLLTTQAPGIQLRVQPPEHDAVGALIRNQVDLLLTPREVLSRVGEFYHELLYMDRYVVTADGNNDLFGATISLEQFQQLPYVATHLNLFPALADAYLDHAGISRNVQITTNFLSAPFLVKNTPLITLTSKIVADILGFRAVEPPLELPNLSTVMAWTSRVHEHPAHRWLRQQIRLIAAGLSPE